MSTTSESIRALTALYRQDEVDAAVAQRRAVVLLPTPRDADMLRGAAKKDIEVTAPMSRWDASLAPLLRGASVIVVGLGMRPVLGPEVASAVLSAGAARVKHVRVGDLDWGRFATAANAAEWCVAQDAAPVADSKRKEADEQPPVGELPTPTHWPEIIAFGDGGPAQDFPLDALPRVVGEHAAAVATATATPPDLAAVVHLGALATVTSRAVEIEAPGGWTCPANGYFLPVMDSGTGKSSVFRQTTRPLVEIEREWLAEASPRIAAAKARKELAEARAAKAAKAAVDGKGASDEEVALLRAEAESIEIPPLPVLMTNDATNEALVELASRAGGTVGVLSHEMGSLMDNMARGSANGEAALGALLDGFEGDPLRVHRVSRPTRTIDRYCLTVVIVGQPVVLRNALRDTNAWERGFLPRFLFCEPPSNVGFRELSTAPIPWAVKSAWEELLRGLAEQVRSRETPTRLRFTAEAAEAYRSWWAQNEGRQRPDDGDLHPIRAWASKAPGHLVRLAGLLSCARTGSIEGTIDLGDVANAIEIVSYFATHVRRAFAAAATSPEAHLAQRLVAWLRRKQIRSFTVREAWRALATSAVQETAQVEEAVRLAADRGYVVPAAQPQRQGRGRPPSPTYFTHPDVLEEGEPR